MAKTYAKMTPAEQRRYDRIDILILRAVDRGWSYARIQRVLGVTPQRIRKVKKECV